MPRTPDDLKDSREFVATKETWVALSQKDHFSLLQLLDRAEAKGGVRRLTIFIRGLLKDVDVPPVVRHEKQVIARSLARTGRKVNTGAREKARRQKRKRYRTGRPCKRGHVAERFAANGSCVECKKSASRGSGSGAMPLTPQHPFPPTH